MALLRILPAILLCGLAWMGTHAPLAQAAATEQQVKAVFLFNFSHFVQWPPGTFTAPAQPFVICLLGGEELAAQLDEAVRAEHVDGHPLQVRQLARVEEVAGCQILFIGRSAAAGLERALAGVVRHATLTVSDLEDAARRGAMIQLVNDDNRIRLTINVEAARAAGLQISSNLLRPARIVRTGQ